MSASAATKSGTRKLSEVARHVVQPAGIVSTGWRDVEIMCRKLGTEFDEWQRGAGRLMFSKTVDGKYAATVGGVGMSLPRQVGKTHLIGYSLFAMCILQPGLTAIWTAHHSKTAMETLLVMQGMARRTRIAPYVRRITTANGKETVWFHNGSRILFGARERGFGRGFAGVDVLVFDEAQILTDRALDAMLAPLNTAPNPLALFMGTPPTPLDPSEAFRRMRGEALSGEAEDMVWIECGADPEADPDDRKQWAKANPSYPHRTPISALLRLRKKLAPESWLREGLGIWDEDGADVFGGAWSACLTDEVPDRPPSSIAVACSVELTHSAIVAAVADDEGRPFIRLLQYGPGTNWVVEAAAGYATQFKASVVVDGGGPAKVLVPNLELEVPDLRVVKTQEVLDACAELFTLVADEKARHRGDPEIDGAVRGAVKRPVGDRWAWGRRKSAADVSALEAATLATWDSLHSVSGPSVFVARRRQPLLVCGPQAAAWIEANGAEGEDVKMWAEARPWERDRYRRQHDARVVVAVESADEYRPSKYGAEELAIVGGDV